MNKEQNREDIMFSLIIAVSATLVVFVTFFPFWYTVVGSLSEGSDYRRGGVVFWPRVFTLNNFRAVFVDSAIVSAYGISAARTILGTVLALFFTSIVSYGMSVSKVRFKSLYAIIFIIPMYFSGGIITQFLLYTKLGLYDNFLVYIFPLAFSSWNMIIILSFFKTIPDSLRESARMDGAGEYRILFVIVMPLAKPVLAAVGLFEAVNHWNAFYDALMFTQSQSLQTMQLYLWRIISSTSAMQAMGSKVASQAMDQIIKFNPQTIKMATIVVTIIPIIAVYPLLQKYFMKGILIGSIKG